MKFKKIIATIVASSLVIGGSYNVFADLVAESKPPIEENIEGSESSLKYVLIQGKITRITEIDSKKHVEVSYDTDKKAVLIVSSETFLVDNIELKEGNTVNFYYDSTKPTTKQYPPTYQASIVVNNSNDNFIKVDYFNEDLVSSDGNLKLNVSDTTKVLDEYGSKYSRSLKNKTLLVFYTTSTRSIPAQTTPSRIIVINDSGNLEEKEVFKSFSGVVKDIFKSEHQTTYLVEDENKAEVSMITDLGTFILDNKEIKKGDSITVAYQVPEVSLTIYPPQYRATAVSLDSENLARSIKIERFDENNLSYDGNLKLNISEETIIKHQDGSVFTGSIVGRKLLISYGPTTMSLPPQTSPYEIVVLYEGNSGPSIQPVPVVPEIKTLDIETVSINGQKYVALRHASEVLNLSITWDAKTESAVLNNSVRVKIDSNVFNIDGKDITLDSPAILKDSKTYVPSDFFSKVLDLSGTINLK